MKTCLDFPIYMCRHKVVLSEVVLSEHVLSKVVLSKIVLSENVLSMVVLSENVLFENVLSDVEIFEEECTHYFPLCVVYKRDVIPKPVKFIYRTFDNIIIHQGTLYTFVQIGIFKDIFNVQAYMEMYFYFDRLNVLYNDNYVAILQYVIIVWSSFGIARVQ